MISKLILGTVQFGLSYGINNSLGKPSKNEIFTILERAYDLGIRTLDTAEAYGDAHNIIESFHKHVDFRFDIITKFSSTIGGYPNNFEERIKQHCKCFDIPRLKGYMFHSFDEFKNTIKLNPTVLQKLKNSKYVDKIGVSVYDNSQVEALLGYDEIDLIQLPFNLFDNENSKKEILLKAKGKGITIHTRSVFLQGLFFLPKEKIKKEFKGLEDGFNTIENIIESNSINKIDLALNYPFTKTYIDNILIGVDSISQLEKNIESLNSFNLFNVYSEIDKINIDNKDLLNPSKW